MAKRKYGMKKIEPAVDTLYMRTPTIPGADPVSGAPGEATFYVDLSQCASLVNRRFYRQGINWVVDSFKFTAVGSKGIVITKIPTTWVAHQAYKAAFEAWNRQQKEAIEESGSESAVARFRDFKVHADPVHAAAGMAANLVPYDFQTPVPQPYATGEWQHSEIVLPNNTGSPSEQRLHMVGANTSGSSRGIIEGYADSRAFPQSPDPVSPGVDQAQNWMSRMFDKADTYGDVLDNATDRNDNLPYPQANYPGGENQAPSLQLHDASLVTNTTVGGHTRMKGGMFPCGLIRIDAVNNDTLASNLVFQINLVPGGHRGYLCESMLEA